jgi:hypothetical protein
VLQRSVPKLLADPATAELIIVIDRDDAETEAIIRRYADADERVRWTRAGRSAEPTLGREQVARDAGVRLAESPVILALDDDVEPGTGLVSGHASHHRRTDNQVVVGYMPVVPPASNRGGIRATAQLYADTYARECARFRSDPSTVLLGLWGGNFSVARHDWLLAANQGGASAGYHVDRELGLRLRRLGLTGVFDPTLRADHWYRRSLREMVNDARSSGRGAARLRDAYPETAMEPARQTRRGLRPLLWASGNPWGFKAEATFLRAVALVARACRMSATEYVCVRLLWRLGATRGHRDALAGSARAS